MATNLIKLLIIANIGLLQAQYTAIPDPCFELQLIQLGIDSEGTNDGQILTSDIVNIIGLDASPNFCNINDLTGIEDFTSLEILYAPFNNLTEIDISHNLQLKKLNCPFNQLTSIDISNNLLLEELVCNNNQISTFISDNNVNLKSLELSNNNISILNLSNLENLEGLGCTNNSIITLNLITNTMLEQIGCIGNNEISSIDLRNGNNSVITNFNTTNCPNLTCIYVDDAQYSTTNWTDIDTNTHFVETESECNALNINGFTLRNISIYPNPTKDILFIENPNTINIENIKIYNLFGQLLLTKNDNFNQINLSTLKPTLYLVTIKTNNGIINTKIIKK